MGLLNQILKFKKTYSILWFVSFLGLFAFCIGLLPNIKITRISLSYLGHNEEVKHIWNPGLSVVVILLYTSVLKNVYLFHKDLIVSKKLIILFSFSTLMLLVTPLISIRHPMHDVTATIYFLGYTTALFLFGFCLLKSNLRAGIVSITMSICSLVFSVSSALMISGLAIPEIIHTLFIFLWDITLAFDSDFSRSTEKCIHID